MNPQAPHLSRRRWIAAGSVAALSTVAAAVITLHGGKAQASANGNAPPPMPVSVATAAETEVQAWDEFSGRLEAVERVEVRSRVAGAVQAAHFREGALVNKGDLLFTIDPAPYAAEVERAEAQVAAAQARVVHSQSEYARAQRLWDERAIAQRELEEKQNGQREAEANVRAAQAQLQSARLNLGYTQVRAPIAGRIGKIDVTVGNLVAAGPGAPVLTTLVSVSPIYASFDTDEQVLLRAMKAAGGKRSADGLPVQMGTAATTDTPYQGRLQLIDNQVDAKSGTVRLRAAFDNKDGTLMPGQFARVRLGQPQSGKAVLVSERAVGTDQDKKFVWVVGEGDKVQWREVTLGAPANGLRIVTSGLKAGERVVVNGLQRVRPGAVVQPQTVSMEGKPA